MGRNVLTYVTDLLRHPDLPLASEGAPTGRSALSGTFAASMERVARLAALTLPAPAALLALFGDDRRCFHAGDLRRAWFAHDSGVLVRSGLLQRTIDSGGTLVLRNALDSGDDRALRAMAAELNLVGLAATTFAADDGTLLGLICAFDDVPREWTDRDVQLLTELAQVAASEVQLRFHIAERELQEHRLRHDSLHDSLTGLPNRTMFMKRLADATQRARRGEDGLFAVLFLDLDGFKLVNDSVGHHVGDEMLVTVARRLEHCVRPGDIVARLGGDEFAILIERITDARDSTAVAERVQRALSVPINIGGYEHVTSASIGVSLSTGPNELPEYILRGADIAMYRAKHGGRGRCEMFDRAMHAEALTRLQIESDLRHAFERQEFFLQYQPIVALGDGRIAGVEALVRWQHAERGVIAPATFVPVAEDTGLVIPLGRWVLREACRQARAWQERYERDRPFTVSVNLSVREFGQKDLVQTLATILAETGLPPSRLKLEITESAIIGQKHPAIEMVDELRALGVGIHLDDFGTGYSALNYLHRLPLDAVKVDRAFTSAIDTEERPLHVVRAIVSLAHAIGMEVVAEGVMSPHQLELLRAMKCDLAQGFLFARPGSVEEIEALLAQDARW